MTPPGPSVMLPIAGSDALPFAQASACSRDRESDQRTQIFNGNGRVSIADKLRIVIVKLPADDDTVARERLAVSAQRKSEKMRLWPEQPLIVNEQHISCFVPLPTDRQITADQVMEIADLFPM